MLPRYVEFTDRIPKTTNQKVQRHLMGKTALGFTTCGHAEAASFQTAVATRLKGR
jgi:acyl-coenzyme A synthetase/AMP-(fatty) acid ligase